MSLNQKIQPYVLALGLGTALNGCAAPTQYERALDVLDATPSMIFEFFPEGYITLRPDSLVLEILAGIYAGNVHVRKTKEGYHAEGGGFLRSEAMSTAMERVLKEADTNGDKIITTQERRALQMKIFEEYAKK